MSLYELDANQRDALLEAAASVQQQPYYLQIAVALLEAPQGVSTPGVCGACGMRLA